MFRVRGLLILVALAIPSGAQAAPACLPLDKSLPWNQAVSGPVHPESARYVDLLWRKGADRPGNINLMFSYAVFDVSAATSEYSVKSELGNLSGQRVPFNDAWRPAHDDGQVVVIDKVKQLTYEFFELTPDPLAHVLRASRADTVPWLIDSNAHRGAHQPSRGIGIPYTAMLVLECEIEAAKIEHALSLRVGNPKCAEAWFPASKVENAPHCVEDGVPEGARFVARFDPDRVEVWARAIRRRGGAELERFGRALAAALQTYGFFVTDSGAGAAAFDIQNVESMSDRSPFVMSVRRNPDLFRDLLDGLLTPESFILVAESGPRLYK